MGKRELLLITAFVIAGALVYQFTAPPSAPGDRGFSLSRLIEGARRELRGRPARAEMTHVVTHPAPAAMQELRVAIRSEMTITGEDRDDIHAELKVSSRGYDDAEAQESAKRTQLKFDDAGGTVTVTVQFPEAGRQTATLTLRIPKRLKVRVDDKSGAFVLADVAAVEMGSSRGKTDISGVPGRVTVTQRGGALTMKDIGSVRLNVRGGADVRLSQVRGDATFNLQSGVLRGSEIRGAIEVESSSADVYLERLQEAAGPIRVNATAGTVELSGLRADTRVDGRSTEIRVEIDRPAPLAIYSEGDERVEFTAPPSGAFTLDAIARGARISADDALLQKWGLRLNGGDSAVEQRVAGPVRGGGPTIILRSNNADIILAQRPPSGS